MAVAFVLRGVAALFFFDNAAVLSKFLTEWPICQDRFDKLRVGYFESDDWELWVMRNYPL